MTGYQYRYLSVPQFLSPAECRLLTEHPDDFHEARVIAAKNEGAVQYKHRKTKVKRLPRDAEFAWVHERIEDKVKELNAQYFRFHISRFEAPEVMRYDPSCFFKRHSDVGQGVISTRKLSVVVFLSPPEDYEGGELLFYPNFPPCDRQQGQFVLFPSYMYHEVTPITRGVRYSLVNWVNGHAIQ